MNPLTHAKKLAFVGVVVFALLLEGAARLWLSQFPPEIDIAMSSGIGDTHWFEILETDLATPDDAPDLYLSDPKRLWKLHPGRSLEVENVVYQTYGEALHWQLSTNADGFRGAPYPSTAQAPVIVALGDSSTFGFRVDDDHSYPAQLQRNLRAHGLAEAQVVNYGIPGYTSFQGRLLLSEILTQHNPDFVILSFGANDHKTDLFSDAEKAARVTTAARELEDYAASPGIIRLFRKPPSLKSRRPGVADALPLRVAEEEFRANMQAMIDLAQRSGARVILLDLEFAEPVFAAATADLALANSLARIDGRTQLRDELLELLEGRRFQEQRLARQSFWKNDLKRYRPIYYSQSFFEELFADPVWNGLLIFFLVDPLHPNALGHQVIAEALAPLIDPSRKERAPTELESETRL